MLLLERVVRWLSLPRALLPPEGADQHDDRCIGRRGTQRVCNAPRAHGCILTTSWRNINHLIAFRCALRSCSVACAAVIGCGRYGERDPDAARVPAVTPPLRPERRRCTGAARDSCAVPGWWAPIAQVVCVCGENEGPCASGRRLCGRDSLPKPDSRVTGAGGAVAVLPNNQREAPPSDRERSSGRCRRQVAQLRKEISLARYTVCAVLSAAALVVVAGGGAAPLDPTAWSPHPDGGCTVQLSGEVTPFGPGLHLRYVDPEPHWGNAVGPCSVPGPRPAQSPAGCKRNGTSSVPRPSLSSRAPGGRTPATC